MGLLLLACDSKVRSPRGFCQYLVWSGHHDHGLLGELEGWVDAGPRRTHASSPPHHPRHHHRVHHRHRAQLTGLLMLALWHLSLEASMKHHHNLTA